MGSTNFMIQASDDFPSVRLPQSSAGPALSPAWQSFLLIWSCEGALLFASVGSRLCIVAFILIATLWIIAKPDASIAALRRNAILFALPLFYFVSSTWSIFPFKTLYSDAALVATFVLAIAIAAAPDRRSAATGVWAAYATFTLFSLIFGGRVYWEAEGLTAFAGLGGGKNVFGHTSALTAITSLCLLSWVWDGKRPLAMRTMALAVFFGIFLISAYAVVIARASGSIIALGLATLTFFVALLSGRASGSIRFLILFAAVSIVLLYVLFGEAIKESVTGLILQTFHKTPALSGRLYFWATADKIIADHPLLGIGYDAFWTHGNPAAEGLWQLYNIPGRSGINFHNTGREILVAGGIVGMVVVVTTIGTLIVKQLIRTVLHGNPVDALGVAITAYYVSRIFTESVDLGLWQPDTIIMLFFLSAPARMSRGAMSTEIKDNLIVPKVRAGQRSYPNSPRRL
ncbi:O-antigen ligase family protein [Sphingomonas glacialis]|nr:O-antigen ligase family protein [Sphingomonas glacialis]